MQKASKTHAAQAKTLKGNNIADPKKGTGKKPNFREEDCMGKILKKGKNCNTRRCKATVAKERVNKPLKENTKECDGTTS